MYNSLHKHVNNKRFISSAVQLDHMLTIKLTKFSITNRCIRTRWRAQIHPVDIQLHLRKVASIGCCSNLIDPAVTMTFNAQPIIFAPDWLPVFKVVLESFI